MHRILSTRIPNEQALVRVRDRTRQIGEVFGLDGLARTRLITAVSEIARNAIDYAGGGKIDYLFDDAMARGGQGIVVIVSDEGPGIDHLQGILDGVLAARGKTPLGIPGSRRLVDAFDIQTAKNAGTTVRLSMRLDAAHPITTRQLNALIEKIAQRKPQTLVEELEVQNREMMLTLEQLRLRQVELERADERKDEFLAMLAHELRNPLSAIGTAVELLRRRESPSAADVTRLTSIVSRQTQQLSRLVNDLLDVSRVTRGKIELDPQVLSVHDIIEHALEMTQGIISAKGHSIQYTPADPSLRISADVVRARQILGNLLHNAARYTPAGGEIRICADRLADKARIRVLDNGIGIDADMLPRVFDLFTQADSGLSRQDAGLGIGLTLVQRLLHAHGGAVEVHSPGLGKGALFTITLPLAHEAAAAVSPPAARRTAAASARILLIDDNRDAVDTLAHLLRGEGHEVAVAHTGEAGLAQSQGFAPDYVVVDVGLPGINGFEVAHALRQAPKTARSVLVALSGYSARNMRERGMQAGFNHYLTKPVDLDQLAAIIVARG